MVFGAIERETLSFTWHDQAFKSQSRLDVFLITADLVYLTKESNVMHTPFSDHSAIMLNIQSVDQRKKSGPGFWKFNASFLEDNEYVAKMCVNIYSGSHRKVQGCHRSWPEMGCNKDGNQRLHGAVLQEKS